MAAADYRQDPILLVHLLVRPRKEIEIAASRNLPHQAGQMLHDNMAVRLR
ncbi:hypothetical protein [uncultured Erythrobacter sp.]|nr:hypothetical protein [uncultured Erythrobacter sp.]